MGSLVVSSPLIWCARGGGGGVSRLFLLCDNVSVNSKPDHPPGQNPWAIFLMGEFPIPGKKKIQNPDSPSL